MKVKFCYYVVDAVRNTLSRKCLIMCKIKYTHPVHNVTLGRSDHDGHLGTEVTCILIAITCRIIMCYDLRNMLLNCFVM